MESGNLNQSDIGHFVAADKDLGIGRLAWLDDDKVGVRYFRGPSPDPYEEREFSQSEVRRVALRPHTRAYFHDGHRWRIGRIDGEQPDLNGSYVIAFPNSEGAVLDEESFDVRWGMRVENPFEILSALGGDSPLVYEPRVNLILEWHRQKAAATGVEGLLLASAELHDHQLTVVRSVTDDTSHRYLLADEVGLGKTIEAGALIWQHLRRDPKAEVLVLAPDHLRQQWADELIDKFHIGQFDEALVRIKAHDDADSWPASPVDMIVVDEAHHMTRSGLYDEANLGRLTELAYQAKDVLLLSATPVRSNEVAFLDLLCLLDPENYQKEDAAAFTQRVEMRDRLALTYQALTPDLGAFEISLYAKQFQATFPEDAVLHHLANQAIECAEADRPEFVNQLREHLSETYRIHHRLLRTRRSSEINESFGVRGRQRGVPFTIDIDDDSDRIRFSLAEEFRQHLAELVELNEISERDAAESFRTLAEACGSLPAALLSMTGSDEHQPDLQDNRPDSLLLEWLQGHGDVWRRELAAYAPIVLEQTVEKIGHMTLSKNRGKVVIASAFWSVAYEVAQALVKNYGKHRVSRHLLSQTREEVAADVERWRSDEACRVLVCDSSAEEGLNLQAAQLVVHLDLPWETFRIEQRIGRADRFHEHTAPPVESIVMMYGDQPFARGWFSLVADGCGVFDHSVSSLQYVLADVESVIQNRTLLEGAPVLDGEIESHQSVLSEEARRIAAHDALDAVRSEHSHLNHILLEADASPLLGFAFKTWLMGVGAKVRNPRKDTMVVAHRPRPQVPFALEMAMAPWAEKELAITRASAVKHRLPILCAGNGLVDAVVEHLSLDDRGVAFAFLRPIQGRWPPTPVFRADFLIEADANQHLAAVAADIELEGWLKLTIDSLMPPASETVFVAGNGAEATHDIVTRPYSKQRRDVNLASRPELFEALTSHLSWVALCERAERAALEALARRPSFATAPDEAAATIASMIGSKISRLQARGDMDIYPIEKQISAFVRLADAMPDRLGVTVDVVGCGAVILADPEMIGS